MIATVKRGDKGTPITVTVNMNLTGSTVKLLARRTTTRTTIELLPTTVTNAPDGVVQHTLQGDLQAGTYRVELKVYRDGLEIATFPSDSFATLRIADDLEGTA